VDREVCRILSSTVLWITTRFYLAAFNTKMVGWKSSRIATRRLFRFRVEGSWKTTRQLQSNLRLSQVPRARLLKFLGPLCNLQDKELEEEVGSDHSPTPIARQRRVAASWAPRMRPKPAAESAGLRRRKAPARRGCSPTGPAYE